MCVDITSLIWDQQVCDYIRGLARIKLRPVAVPEGLVLAKRYLKFGQDDWERIRLVLLELPKAELYLGMADDWWVYMDSKEAVDVMGSFAHYMHLMYNEVSCLPPHNNGV